MGNGILISIQISKWVRDRLIGETPGMCHLEVEVFNRRKISKNFPDCFSSVARSVVSSSLRHHGLQHTRPPCPSPARGIYSNSCPLSRWCHPTISSSVPFSSCLQAFPASGSLPMGQFFTSDGQSIGVSASASVLPMNITFRMDWLNLLAVQGTLKSLLQHHSSKALIFQCSAFTSWQIDGEKVETVTNFYSLRLQNQYGQWLQPRNYKMLAPWKKSYDKPRQCIKKQRHHFADKGPYIESYDFLQ